MGVFDTNPRTWVTGDLVDAAGLNTEIRDPLTSLQSAWTSYTPTVTGSVSNPSIGTSPNLLGRYHRWGKTVFGQFYVQPGTGATAGSGAWQISAPVPANMGSTNQSMVGEGYYYDTSAGTLYVGRVRLQAAIGGGTGTSFIIILRGTSYYAGAGGPAVPEAGDQFAGNFRYEAA